MPPFRSYILCTSPRSGSTLLCTMLRATGVAGHPGSHFYAPSIEAWLEEFGLSRTAGEQSDQTLRRVFDAAIQRGKGASDIFALRMQRHSFDYFAGQLRLIAPGYQTDRDRLEAIFGKTLFIYLRRDDKIAQAISYVKAQQTGLWHKAPDGREIERLKPPSEPIYDFGSLREAYDTFMRYEEQWLDWFQRENISPISLTYDAVSNDPTGVLHRVVTALGLDPEAAMHVRPGTARLADTLSREWADRFKSDLADRERA